jgi:hypothetical protein
LLITIKWQWDRFHLPLTLIIGNSLFGSGDDEVFKIACDNFELDSNGNFHLIRKSLPPPFPSFRTYSDYLRQTLKLVFQDGAERGYRPLATCSIGYDLACAATLAAKLGCREAVTLKSPPWRRQ